jgi:hypothetical protein
MSLSGAFAEEGTQTNIQVGEFHAQMTLDSGETIRVKEVRNWYNKTQLTQAANTPILTPILHPQSLLK